MVGIKDIAKKAGVAISTVSYAINNHPKVSDKTRRKIMKIVKEFGYKPNIAARSLKSKKTHTIGLFLQDLNMPYFEQLIMGIEDELIKKRHELIISPTCGTRGVQSIVDFIFSNRIDGAIVFGASLIPENMLIQIGKGKIPVVFFDIDPNLNTIKNSKSCAICLENIEPVVKAVKYLIDNGYKKVGYLNGDKRSYDNRVRFKAYKKTLKENNIEYNKEWKVEGKYSEEIAYKNILPLIEANNLPEAFFCANDQMALGAIRALMNKKIKIPQKIALIGFDDIRIAKLISPALTTISYDRRAMGEKAVKQLFLMMKNNNYEKKIFIKSQFVIRESA